MPEISAGADPCWPVGRSAEGLQADFEVLARGLEFFVEGQAFGEPAQHACQLLHSVD